MAWGIDRGRLEAGREEMHTQAAERPSHHVLDQLARAHRRLGEDEQARRRFRAARARSGTRAPRPRPAARSRG